MPEAGRRPARIFAGLCIWLAVCGGGVQAAASQSADASIRGTVRDQTGGAVPAARIVLTSIDAGTARETAPAADGTFIFLALPPGRYRLIIASPGFAPIDRMVELTIDERRDLPFVLVVEAAAQAISVVPDAAPPIDASIAAGRTILPREIDDLPVPTGTVQDFTAFAALAPGVAVDPTGSGVAANGQTGNNNTFYLDGLDSDSPIAGGVLINLPLGAVREFRSVAHHAGPEFGQASGVIVNVVTRSGTNSPAGRVYWLQQDGAWNATSPTARSVGAEDPGQAQTLVGGFWGGPIVRSRAFLFVAPEYVDRRVTYVNTSPLIAAFRPRDPRSWPIVTRAPKLFARADLHAGRRNVLTIRASTLRNTSNDAQREPQSARERGRSQRNPIRNVAVLDTHVVASTEVNEVRLQWGHTNFATMTDGFCPGCAALNYPDIKLGKAANAPQLFTGDRAEAADVFTWLAGGAGMRHTIKLGVDVDVVQQSGLNPLNTAGTYTFRPGTPPFDPLDPLSYPSRFTQNLGDARFRVAETIASVFAQDEWRVARAVTAVAGLRWDSTAWPGAPDRRDDVAPRLGLIIDPGGTGRTVIRAAAGRYFDEVLLMIARDAQTGFVQMTIDNPGFQGSPAAFDTAGRNPRRSGPIVPRLSLNGSARVHTGYSDQASAGVQHQLGAHAALVIDIVRARGARLPVGGDLNVADAVTRLRPNPGFEQILVTESRGHSWYTGLEAGLRRVLARGYAYSAAYTWASAENDTDGRAALPQDRSNLTADRGPTANAARHRLSASLTTQLPYRWQLSAVVAARSGLPYNITTGSDDNHDLSLANDRPAGVRRNSARGSPSVSADLRAMTSLAAGPARLDVFLEAFNVTNHANWADYNGVRTSATFARPATAGPPRQLQAGVRFNF